MAKTKSKSNNNDVDEKILHKLIKSHNIQNGKNDALELIAKELNYVLNSKKRRGKLRWKIISCLKRGVE